MSCGHADRPSGAGTIEHKGVNDHRWVAPHELDEYEFPAADEKTIAKLLGL